MSSNPVYSVWVAGVVVPRPLRYFGSCRTGSAELPGHPHARDALRHVAPFPARAAFAAFAAFVAFRFLFFCLDFAPAPRLGSCAR